jgi:hypothetical protein
MRARSVVAIIVFVVIVAATFAWAIMERTDALSELSRQLRDAPAPLGAPVNLNELDLDDISDLGMEVSPEMWRQLNWSELILTMWPIWIPIVALICFGAAMIRRSPKVKSANE